MTRGVASSVCTYPGCTTATPKGKGQCKIHERLRSRAKRFGLSMEEYKAYFDSQRGECFICPDPATDLDHCHKTGKIRKALCHSCNQIVARIEGGRTTRIHRPKYYNYIDSCGETI